MTLPVIARKAQTDLTLIKVAREIAINHFPLETILEKHKITLAEWEKIKANPRFAALLDAEIADWHGATNTVERTKLKAAAIIEEFLPEGNTRIHDNSENLNAKVELLKWLARIAGMGEKDATITAGGGERLNVTINLGADAKLEFDKQLPPRVINAETETGCETPHSLTLIPDSPKPTS